MHQDSIERLNFTAKRNMPCLKGRIARGSHGTCGRYQAAVHPTQFLEARGLTVCRKRTSAGESSSRFIESHCAWAIMLSRIANNYLYKVAEVSKRCKALVGCNGA